MSLREGWDGILSDSDGFPTFLAGGALTLLRPGLQDGGRSEHGAMHPDLNAFCQRHIRTEQDVLFLARAEGAATRSILPFGRRQVVPC